MATRYMSFRNFFESAQKRAEHHLNTRADEAVECQLATQRIVKIVRYPFLAASARLYSCAYECGFHVGICDDLDLKEQLLCVGHELAHTFEYFDGTSLVKPPYHDEQEMYVEREAFCEQFANRWIQKPVVEKQLTELLQRKSQWFLPHTLLKKLESSLVLTYLPAT